MRGWDEYDGVGVCECGEYFVWRGDVERVVRVARGGMEWIGGVDDFGGGDELYGEDFD